MSPRCISIAPRAYSRCSQKVKRAIAAHSKRRVDLLFQVLQRGPQNGGELWRLRGGPEREAGTHRLRSGEGEEGARRYYQHAQELAGLQQSGEFLIPKQVACQLDNNVIPSILFSPMFIFLNVSLPKACLVLHWVNKSAQRSFGMPPNFALVDVRKV